MIIRCAKFLISLRASLVFMLILAGSMSILAQISDYTWGNVQIGGGGYVTGIAIHPGNKDHVYIRTDVGGAYRWDAIKRQWDQMLNWIGPENDNLIGVDGIALDPANPDRIYLALGQRIAEDGGLFRSEDRGKTWTRLMTAGFEGNGREARWFGECIAVDPVNSRIIYAGTRKDGLWRSMDDGMTWKKIPDVPAGYTGIRPTGVRTLVFDPSQKTGNQSTTLYVGIPGTGLYFSKDGGATFSILTGSPKNPARMQVVNSELFVTHSTGVALFSGGEWTDITPEAGKNYVGLAVDETDSRKLVAAQRYRTFYNPIYRSHDKGKTWHHVNGKELPFKLHIDIPWWPEKRFSSATAGMAFAPGGKGELWYTDWFGSWFSPDIWADTTHWYTPQKGHEETVVLTLNAPPAGALLYSGVADVFGFKHEKIDTYPKDNLYTLKECFSIAVCEKQPTHIAILGAKSWGGDATQLVTSPDAGETWTIRTLPEGTKLGIISISAINPDRMVYLSGKGKAYYSHNRGDTWKEALNIPENLIDVAQIWSKDEVMASDLADGSFYILAENTLYHSEDGTSWSASGKIPVNELSGQTRNIATAPGLKGEVWVSLGKEGLWKTSDGGHHFTRITSIQTAKFISWGAPAPGTTTPTSWCYGTMDDKWGMYRSTDMGSSWVRVNDNQHHFPGGVKAIAGDRNVFGRIFIGSGGCGVYYGEPAEIVKKEVNAPKLSDPKSFTWIVLPDPQTYTKFGRNQALFELMTAWIKDQKKNLNIQMVLCEGDLVEQNDITFPDSINGDQTSEEQWKSVSAAFNNLDGFVPYILCTGNHDLGIKSAENRQSRFSTYFTPDRNPLNRKILVEMAPNGQGKKTLENSCYEWHSPAGQSFLIFSLEFAPRLETLSWAKALAASPAYKNHIGVVLTHSYINSKGELISREKYRLEGANYGETIWTELVEPSSNIGFVLSGHVADSESHRGQVGYRKAPNRAGMDVHQMMFNAQREGGGWHGNGGDGWLRIMEFLPDLKTVKVSTFSPLFFISPSTRHLSWREEQFDKFTLTY